MAKNNLSNLIASVKMLSIGLSTNVLWTLEGGEGGDYSVLVIY